jgi:hypothetical protein
MVDRRRRRVPQQQVGNVGRSTLPGGRRNLPGIDRRRTTVAISLPIAGSRIGDDVERPLIDDDLAGRS